MSGSTVAYLLAVSVFLVFSLPDVSAYRCHQRGILGLDTYTYCSWGCCGDYDYQYCCRSYQWKYIVGGSVGSVAFVIGMIALCCWCCCYHPRRTTVTTTTTAAPAPVIFSSSSSMQMAGGAYPAQPQPYPGTAGYGYPSNPPSYDNAMSTGMVNQGYVK